MLRSFAAFAPLAGDASLDGGGCSSLDDLAFVGSCFHLGFYQAELLRCDGNEAQVVACGVQDGRLAVGVVGAHGGAADDAPVAPQVDAVPQAKQEEEDEDALWV